MKYFKNITKERITETFDSKQVIIEPGRAVRLDDYVAEKFAKAAAEREVFNERYADEQKALEKGQKIKPLPLGAKELKDRMAKYLQDIEIEDEIEISELSDLKAEGKSSKKAPKKKKVLTDEEKPDDSEFED